MADSSALKDAANRLMLEARRFIEQIEAEDAASANAPVPAHMVNMPPETRALRPDVAALTPQQVTDADANASASADDDNKTAAADHLKAASDASKADASTPTARRSTS